MRIKIQDPRRPAGYRIVELNRRKAIAERCLNCSGFIPSERAYCEMTDCELFPFRMGKGKQDADLRNRQIRAYCRDNCMCGNSWLVANCTTPDCPLYAYRKSTIDRSVVVDRKPYKQESRLDNAQFKNRRNHVTNGRK